MTNEWSAILGLGSSAPNYAYVSISYTKNGDSLVQNGMIIIPSGVDVSNYNIIRGQKYNTSSSSSSTANWTGVPQITDVQFGELEKLGCVFLPAFGYVSHTGNSGTWSDDGKGYYRTCDAVGSGSSCAYVICFSPSAEPEFLDDKHNGAGIAVRLIYVAGPNSSSTSSKSQTIQIR